MKDRSSKEGFQECRGREGRLDIEKGAEHSHEIILELLLNCPDSYLTGTCDLGVPLVSVWWLVVMAAYGLHS